MTGRKRKHLLIILGAVLALILAGAGGALLWQRWTPAQIGDRVRLEDLEPGQAVLIKERLQCYLIVDNQGRWKYVTLGAMDDETLQWFRRYEFYPLIELCDLILANDKIPYGKGRVPRKLLEWAVNVESVALKSVPEEDEKESGGIGCAADFTTIASYWAIAGVGEERKEVLLREEEWDSYVLKKVRAWSDDIRIAMMCNTLDLLMGGERAERKKHFFIGIGIAFVLLLALIAGTWFWRRKVSRNREETEQA